MKAEKEPTLKHVWMWEDQIGYRPVTIDEATQKYREFVSASSKIFVCSLCMEAAELRYRDVPKRGEETVYFSHGKASKNKDCEERVARNGENDAKTLKNFHAHVMPMRLSIRGYQGFLEMGFVNLPSQKLNRYTDQTLTIYIGNDKRQSYVYTIRDRLSDSGISYVSVGSTPAHQYQLIFPKELNPYWPKEVSIPNLFDKGVFFDARNGRRIPIGGKIFLHRPYYFLHKKGTRGASNIRGISQTYTGIDFDPPGKWVLERIQVENLDQNTAFFFISRGLFLTEKKTEYYPIWPVCTEDSYFLYHHGMALQKIYFYLNDRTTRFEVYPWNGARRISAEWYVPNENGRIFGIPTGGRDQLVSVGQYGAIGFTYLQRKSKYTEPVFPHMTIMDAQEHVIEKNILESREPDPYWIIKNILYDGKVVYSKNGTIYRIDRLKAKEDYVLRHIQRGSIISIYQGIDCVRECTYAPLQGKIENETRKDQAIAMKLASFRGYPMPVGHELGHWKDKLSTYPKVIDWLYLKIREGYMACDAYTYLRKLIQDERRKKEDGR